LDDYPTMQLASCNVLLISRNHTTVWTAGTVASR
jgi:hypothetical protein